MVEKFKTELNYYNYYELACSIRGKNRTRATAFDVNDASLQPLPSLLHETLPNFPIWACLVVAHSLTLLKGYYLKQNRFFGNASYLHVELQIALNALTTAHVRPP
jgi:hypothetical protein